MQFLATAQCCRVGITTFIAADGIVSHALAYATIQDQLADPRFRQ